MSYSHSLIMPTSTTCRHPHASPPTPRVSSVNGVRTSSRGRPLRPAVREWWLIPSSSMPPTLRTSRASFQQSVTIPTIRCMPVPLVQKTSRAPATSTVPPVSCRAPAPASNCVQPDYCTALIPVENAEDTGSSSSVHCREKNYPPFSARFKPRSSVRAMRNAETGLPVAKHVTANSDGLVVCQFCEPFDSSKNCLCRFCGRGMTGSPTDMVYSGSNCSSIKLGLLDGMVEFAHKQSSCWPSHKRSRNIYETDREQLSELGRVKRRRYNEGHDRGEANRSRHNYDGNCFCAANTNTA